MRFSSFSYASAILLSCSTVLANPDWTEWGNVDLGVKDSGSDSQVSASTSCSTGSHAFNTEAASGPSKTHLNGPSGSAGTPGAQQSGVQQSGSGQSGSGHSGSSGSHGKGRNGASKTKAPVSYSGPAFTGTLPASLSTLVFPTNSARPAFPHLRSGRLGQNALPQGKTNGDSKLGTFDAPKLPPFLGSSASGSRFSGTPPWGNRTANGTNPYHSAPSTGVVRSYTFTVARGTMAPDGVEREVLVVNDAFPGPTIEANWGDTIEVTVVNAITGPEEGTALHWHGLLQVNTEYEDGVPGISQCPIAPGETVTYRFNADLYGTSWWHSHYSAQYAGGALGAMIIHGPDNADYDEDLGPVMLTDYYHDDYFSILKDVMGTDLTKIAPSSQNNLINGKGNYNCSLVTDNTTCTENAGLAKFGFTSGQTHRLRLINGGAEAIQRFSIDDHVMEVIAYDFVPIVPYTTNQVTLAVGQRADVLVKANGNASGSYWMRSSISTLCSVTDNPDALAIIYYENANTTAQPTSTSWTIDDSTCANDALSKTVPSFPIKPPTANTTVEVALSFELNSTGNFLWTMDASSFRTDYNNPILPLLQADNSTANINEFPTEWNVYNFGSNKSFVIVINNENPVAHPMHIHGHNMFVLSDGIGTWDGTTQGSTSNPARRDVQLLQPDGYIAIQIDADNPGVWPFHCHIAWHVSGGLYMNILERPADIPSMVKTPSDVDALCTSWDAWTAKQAPDQIDSGLRKRSQSAGVRERRHLKSHRVGNVRHNL